MVSVVISCVDVSKILKKVLLGAQILIACYQIASVMSIMVYASFVHAVTYPVHRICWCNCVQPFSFFCTLVGTGWALPGVFMKVSD